MQAFEQASEKETQNEQAYVHASRLKKLVTGVVLGLLLLGLCIGLGVGYGLKGGSGGKDQSGDQLFLNSSSQLNFFQLNADQARSQLKQMKQLVSVPDRRTAEDGHAWPLAHFLSGPLPISTAAAVMLLSLYM